jgi:predicted transcriptional regulator
MQATKFIQNKIRTDILTQLSDTGMIEVEQNKNTNGTISYLYKAINQ